MQKQNTNIFLKILKKQTKAAWTATGLIFINSPPFMSSKRPITVFMSACRSGVGSICMMLCAQRSSAVLPHNNESKQCSKGQVSLMACKANLCDLMMSARSSALDMSCAVQNWPNFRRAVLAYKNSE